MTRVLDIEDHTVSIYSTWRSAWSICACTWHSRIWRACSDAQLEWALHVAALVGA